MKNKIYKGIFSTSTASFLVCVAMFIIVIEVKLGLSIADLALPLVLSIAIAFCVSIILSKALSARIVKPLEDINPENAKRHEYEEIEKRISPHRSLCQRRLPFMLTNLSMVKRGSL